MTFIRIAGMVALLVTAFSCRHGSTSPEAEGPVRDLSLRASSATGVAPCDIVFTGTFNAYADTITMHVPDMFLMGGPGRTIIRYALPDTSIPALRTYSSTRHFSSAGYYQMYMVLQTTTRDIFSDTLFITVY